MGGQAVRWTAEQVMALAPDDTSRRAGSKLSAPGPWREAGSDGGAVWGLCNGSGSTPYRTVVELNGGQGPAYKCSCPSRKFPCKHAVGLLLLWAEDETAVTEAPQPPEWAGAWLEGRRNRAAGKTPGRSADGATRTTGGPAGTEDGAGAARDTEEARDDTAGSGPSGAGPATDNPTAGSTATGSTAADGPAADSPAEGGSSGSGARAEGARRRAGQRAARIAVGAEELEQRLADLLRGGLAGTDQAGYAPWEEMAARMVDAQAPGLAARIRELGTLPGSGEGWPERLLSECALLHLLARAYLRLDALPAPLAETVRARVGLTVEAAELLADEGSLIRDEWLVLAQRDTEEGRLTARRVWLHGRATGRRALLLSYGAGGRAPELALPVGTVLEADLAYYPGAGPLRAALGERHGAPLPGFPPPGGSVPDALSAYGQALCADPWLDGWPFVLREVVPVPPPEAGTGAEAGPGAGAAKAGERGWQLADAEAEFALPIAPGTAEGALWKLLALSAEGPVTVFGEVGHRGFAPHTAWSEDRAVPL
ncbi:SWIM zinc finger domain-containing protein [Streptomyces sp. NBC_01795]|uniref:SWIM zinc finger family protein n=1 Tax=Streptomyces sp. NBC_01795 TaxID=2975943 RepID=UPI002DDAF421|nr:SWIM zinc finger family protein [Streptomyces sp. NBC_01795]WSA92873.1 SWIM zinc finger domain-containing protein [Streptomyces sp. NBC_01795]